MDSKTSRGAISTYGMRELKDLVPETINNMQSIINNADYAIPSGFSDLDAFTGGFKPGEVTMIAGYYSIGSTTLASGILLNQIKRSPCTPVAFFSLDLNKFELTSRILHSQAEVELSTDTIKPEDISKLARAAEVLGKSNVFIDDTKSLTLEQLQTSARRLVREESVKLIIIDKSQFMRCTDDLEDDVRQHIISSGIKKLAQELGVPIIITARLELPAKSYQWHVMRPYLSNMTHHQVIEPYTDIIVLLHRDRDAQKNMTDDGRRRGIPSELIVEKNRFGPTGLCEVIFFPQYTLFKNKTHRYGSEDLPEGL